MEKVVYYDDNIISDKAKEAILLQFQEEFQMSDQGSKFEESNMNLAIVEQDSVQNNSSNPTNLTIFSLLYYQQFFNVNTEDVLKRIKGSLFPSMKMNYYETEIKARPDLYGPVWVCLTLAFSIAIGSNLLDYFSFEEKHWRYGFHVITKAFFIVFVYSWIIPIMLWSMLKWYLLSQVNISALELICTYGYALVVYIPLSICWIVHIPYLQVSLMILGAISSGLVLSSTMQPVVRKEDYIIVAAMILLHICFSGVIFLYFFQVK